MSENVSWMDVVILLAQRVYSEKRNRTWKDSIMSPSVMQAQALGSPEVQEAHFSVSLVLISEDQVSLGSTHVEDASGSRFFPKSI